MGAVGTAIRQLREDRGWTQEQLAQLMGMSRPALGKRETGETQVRRNEMRKFAEVFGMSLSDFEDAWRAQKIDQPRPLGGAIPVINSAPAGLAVDYEEFGTSTGEGYMTIDRGTVEDELAFAVDVVGDSMEPTLHERDIVVFAPLVNGKDRAKLTDGRVVFVRFSNDPEAPRQGCTIARFFWVDTQTGAFRLAKDNTRYPETRALLVPEQIARISIAVEVRSRRGL